MNAARFPSGETTTGAIERPRPLVAESPRVDEAVSALQLPPPTSQVHFLLPMNNATFRPSLESSARWAGMFRGSILPAPARVSAPATFGALNNALRVFLTGSTSIHSKPVGVEDR